MREQSQREGREPDGEGAFADALRDRLRGSEALDVVVAARLAAARRRAFDVPATPWRWWLASGGSLAAAALVALLMFGEPLHRGADATVEISSADALDLMIDEEDADFYEDLDLYRWLSETPAEGTDAHV